LDQLPEQRLTPEEVALGQAVMDFLSNRRLASGADVGGAPPTMAALAGDPIVRDFKGAALPREVSLKAWLRQRFNHRVEMQGQSIVVIS